MHHIDHELEKDPNNSFYKTERLFVDEICATSHSNKNGTQVHHNDLDLTSDDLHRYLKDFGQSCDDMLLRCYFEVRISQKSSNHFL